jgi:Zn-dependent peptidase ImmA (M78 family)
MAIRKKLIRTLTEDLVRRSKIKSGPIPIERIAKSLRIIILTNDFDGATDISGFLFRDQANNRTVIGVNSSNSRERQRFTIAHEIGHFRLHEGDVFHVDRSLRLKLRDQKSSTGTDRDEIEANLFAAELLMPKTFLDKDVQSTPDLDLLDEDAIQSLAEKYKVSVQSLTYRLMNLGYIES